MDLVNFIISQVKQHMKEIGHKINFKDLVNFCVIQVNFIIRNLIRCNNYLITRTLIILMSIGCIMRVILQEIRKMDKEKWYLQTVNILQETFRKIWLMGLGNFIEIMDRLLRVYGVRINQYRLNNEINMNRRINSLMIIFYIFINKFMSYIIFKNK